MNFLTNLLLGKIFLAYLSMHYEVGHIWDCQLLAAKVRVPSVMKI